MNKKIQTAIVGGGCFWCTEAIFQEVKGVVKVKPGYAGGTVPGKPTYREVCSGLTGHAEVVEITFDSSIITYREILRIFMTTHDPTTLNRQGADKGTQYRSIIFYQNKKEQEIAKKVIEELINIFESPIVTEVSELIIFFEAETEHQNYYKNNSEQAYCSFVITPKLKKMKELHSNYLK
ncbi:MAG: peptide-methionine (S)-S-oxide reductase MsrA [Flavobacteriaceae bacterium]|nr:peptide-methionine (S)-S-oxide reductase MsrA [Flavobacteriaceae bacterium]